MTMPTTARERSGKAEAGSDGDEIEVVPISLLLDGEWVEVEVDVQGLTFREHSLIDAAVDSLPHAPSATMRALLAAWATLRRSRPDLSLDDVLDLPSRSMRIDNPRPPRSPDTGEASGVG